MALAHEDGPSTQSACATPASAQRGGDAEEDARGLCRLLGLRPSASIFAASADADHYAAALRRLGHRVDRLEQRRQPASYDLVFDVPSRLGYLRSQDEASKVLKGWRSNLKAEGWLVIGIPTTPPVRHRDQADGPVPLIEDFRTQAARGFAQGGLPPVESLPVSRSLSQMIAMLHAAGFGYLQIFGSLRGTAKKPDDPIVAIAQNV